MRYLETMKLSSGSTCDLTAEKKEPCDTKGRLASPPVYNGKTSEHLRYCDMHHTANSDHC